jgi:hypothetical protein
MEVKKQEVNFENIAPSKLLNYVKKSELVSFLSPPKYQELENQLRQQLNKEKITLRDVKKFLSELPEFITSLKNNQLGQTAWMKYETAVSSMRDPQMRKKMRVVREGMTQPRRRMTGCLATKIQPEDYADCLDNYNDDRYDNIKIIPTALKQRVGEHTQNPVLKSALLSTTTGFNDLPSGLRTFIKRNPTEFKNYFQERRHELNLIKSVMKNLAPAEKQALQNFYRQSKNLTFEDFQGVINKTRQPIVGRGTSKITGGCDKPNCTCDKKGGQEDDLLSNYSHDTNFTDLLNFDSPLF